MDDDRPTPTDLRVLAIDDEPFQLKLLSKQLAGLGIDQVRTCLEAAVALAQLQADPACVDLVCCDLQMPEMDGIEATRRIRVLPLAHQPEIVAMTASVLERDRDECLEAGMDAFLVKPFRPADVAKTLEACHGRLESAGDAATPERELVRRGA